MPTARDIKNLLLYGGTAHFPRAAASALLLYLLNLPLYLYNPLFYPPLFSIGAASYHTAFFGLYTLWGWAFLASSLLISALINPALGALLAYIGGFFLALALRSGSKRLFSLLLYLVLYVSLTNVLVLVSQFMPYLVEREDVPDPAHAPLYFFYYWALHWVFGRLVKPDLISAARLRAMARALLRGFGRASRGHAAVMR
ncbi:conserved hypothetical protein [Pyrobaculum arsenaticum DSM 13514]|uniref:Uncharacterized protein n=2 Tax=Thermoproteaceae TaxID=2267 RepID=A4WKM1_PYRAR|nr:conserved hypothetical protein [Pyrobaculum arsenaticum DSM 13514]